MIIKHSFVHISEATKPRPNSPSMNGGIAGSIIGCAYCGQVRRVWADGTVEVVVRGDEHSDQPDNRHPD